MSFPLLISMGDDACRQGTYVLNAIDIRSVRFEVPPNYDPDMTYEPQSTTHAACKQSSTLNSPIEHEWQYE